MTGGRKNLFSVKDEIAVHSGLPHERVSAEPLPEPDRAAADYYNSAAFEPGRPGAERKFQELIQAENAKYTTLAIVAVTILSGIIGGVFAVPAVFLRGNISWIQIFMLVVFGPFAEETLKQSGAVFQRFTDGSAGKYPSGSTVPIRSNSGAVRAIMEI